MLPPLLANAVEEAFEEEVDEAHPEEREAEAEVATTRACNCKPDPHQTLLAIIAVVKDIFPLTVPLLENPVHSMQQQQRPTVRRSKT